jgi:DNA polymerase elongation subunit (family B)
LIKDDKAITMTGAEMRDLIRANNWCITANGTVFDLSREGIIPFCLTKWYDERIEYRKKSGEFKKKAAEAKEAGDTVQAEEFAAQAEFYNMVQEAKKRFLNSTYGAYLNRFFRFYDARCGRSVTLSGRVVVKHMCRKACELLGGTYEFNNMVLLAGDTDSTYITYEDFLNRNHIEKTIENVVMLGDWVGEQINESFVDYLSEQFLVPPERCRVVQVKRETIFDRAIFKDKKKRYAMHIVDAEGFRVPKGSKDELKIVGMEVKRSDTPKHIQDFLQECLRLVLVEGHDEEDLRQYVNEFRGKFRQLPAWKRGSPVRVHNLKTTIDKLAQYDSAQDKHDFTVKKPLAYWAVVASHNTNILMSRFKEERWESIKDGDKVEILYLQSGNEYGMETVAIRVGEEYIPEWFKALPFDDAAHEQKLIDQKLDNTFGGLGWEFAPREHTGWDIFV